MGQPQSGPVPVVFNLYDQPVGGTLLYTESQTVQANAGLLDARIGSRYLFVGPGFGGTNFVNDIAMLRASAKRVGFCVRLYSKPLCSPGDFWA